MTLREARKEREKLEGLIADASGTKIDYKYATGTVENFAKTFIEDKAILDGPTDTKDLSVCSQLKG